MKQRIVSSKVPIAIEFPDEMSQTVLDVLNGEYESWFFGTNLVILDIGANVGSFSIWANLRWPQSRIYAYEPHPDTFKTLKKNVENSENTTCYNFAVYPGEKQGLLWSRYSGDGESGLVSYMGQTFENLTQNNIFEVPLLHPRNLPKCDVMKLDVEGAESTILQNMNLKGISLIILEYQNNENRRSIKDLLKDDFALEYEDSYEWDTLLPNSNYNKKLAGDQYGRLFFANKRQNKLRKLDSNKLYSLTEHNLHVLSLRQLLLESLKTVSYKLKVGAKAISKYANNK